MKMCFSSIAILACMVLCAGAQAQTEWTTDWTGWMPSPGGDTGRVTVDNTGTELVVYYNGTGNTFDGWGPQIEVTGLSPAIPAANEWLRMEVTLTGWETGLAGYNFANEDGWFASDAGRETGDNNCCFRFNSSILRFHVASTVTTRQILVMDLSELSSKNKWSGDDWGVADAANVNFEIPWNGNDKVMAQWSEANTKLQYVGFFATKEEALAAGNGAAPTRLVEAGVEIPDVSAMNQADATAALEAAGFVVDVVQEASDTVAAGGIIRTEPEVGSSAEAGSTVTLVISTGSASSDLPAAGLVGLALLGVAFVGSAAAKLRNRK